ncbi:glycosyltransferase family 2 protein [Brevundimonas sp. R86498]|uniref:glycosyltransferase family 2 protein n=1 Tax=Brevundimonas sp. R86498 TaxID=3093845 RepID=UPI0037CA4DAD
MARTGASGIARIQDAAYPHRASQRSLGLGQALVWLAISGAGVAAFLAAPDVMLKQSVFAVQLAFVLYGFWRCLLAVASLNMPAPWPMVRGQKLPRYTVLVALLDEAEILPQLVPRLAAIDYPRDRLEGYLLLEAHDRATIAAARACSLPPWLQVCVVPEDGQRTKPHALNHGLAAARGQFVTVYDAEDAPDPLQQREAAQRFAADTTGSLWALQSPLRIRTRDRSDSPFLDRQFAVEYAALFEVTLPAMARLGLPFPLGGTSNHFRVDALRAVGGWDAHNVTEDADLGFRLWRAGGRLGTLSRPTLEPPPGALVDWLPQRTRWLKGYMQTWGVHTRDLRRLGWRGCASLALTVGVALASAAIHAGTVAWVVASVAIALAAGLQPATPIFAMAVLAWGTSAAWLTGHVGAGRAGVPYTPVDMIVAPAYWSLLSLGFYHALWRLVREPFAWDKTRHSPDPGLPNSHLDAGREVA